MADNTLSHYCESLYFPLNLRCRSELTRYQYRHSIRAFGKHLGREPLLEDLTDDSLTIWMSRLLSGGRSVATVREMAGRISSLWTWLAKRGMVKTWPTFTKPEAPQSLPTALTEDQIRALFHSAGKERGRISGIPADLWWVSFLAFIWTTAERKSAAMAVRVNWIDFNTGSCTIPPAVRKGGKKWAVYRLWPETLQLIAKCLNAQPLRELMWPWEYCHESYYTHYNRILVDAGIPVSRKTKTHALRCSHATWLAVAGGDPTRQLGHSDPGTTNKFYLDPRQLPDNQPKLFVPWRAPDAG